MNKNIILYPEVLSAVVKNKEEDIFTIWLLAKKIDFNNNGLVDLKELINIAKISLGISSSFIYNKINKGIDLYWRKPSGKNGKKLVGLHSINKIVNRLQPEITRVKPVEINQNLFKANSLNLKFLRQLYAAIVIGRYNDCRPISIETLKNNLGLSESSIHNIIKSSEFIKVYNNFQTLYEFESLLDARQKLQILNSSKYKIVSQKNKFFVTKQLSNSYILSDFIRKPIKSRPRALKQNDKLMLDKLDQKRYYVNGFDKTVENCKIISNLSYVSV